MREASFFGLLDQRVDTKCILTLTTFADKNKTVVRGPGIYDLALSLCTFLGEW